jgi:hypothetical protein
MKRKISKFAIWLYLKTRSGLHHENIEDAALFRARYQVQQLTREVSKLKQELVILKMKWFTFSLFK